MQSEDMLNYVSTDRLKKKKPNTLKAFSSATYNFQDELLHIKPQCLFLQSSKSPEVTHVRATSSTFAPPTNKNNNANRMKEMHPRCPSSNSVPHN